MFELHKSAYKYVNVEPRLFLNKSFKRTMHRFIRVAVLSFEAQRSK